MEKQYYSAIHNSPEIWKKSSSGGAFTALTDCWFAAHGSRAIVYGCVLDRDLKAKHMRAAKPEQRDEMRGSKYISSNMTGIYPQVEQDLTEGNWVLFSGTPCQVAGLNSYLRVKKSDTRQLLTLEVICHGVGSNRFFDDYIFHLEKKYGSRAIKCSFRGKSRPEKIQEMQVMFQNNRKYVSAAARFDWFLTAYQRNYILRPSCLNCQCASQADISIGDHWAEQGGLAKTLVAANTERGNRWIHQSQDRIVLTCLCEEDVHKHVPAQKPRDYEEFWRIYKNDGYLAAQTWLGNHTLRTRITAAVVDILYRLRITSAVKQLKRRLRKH